MDNVIKTDEDFLLWIANRLVFKYKENRSILDRVIFIIEKNKTIKKVLDDNNLSLTKSISEAIKYLDLAKRNNQSEIAALSSKFRDIRIDMNIANLDNIDMDYLLKGVLK
jgi:hypothetical protein